MKDRRIARRYDLSLPVGIRIHVENETLSRTGSTRDISIRGVYFTIDNELNAGTELDLTMTLPGEVSSAAKVFFRATGKVVRVDKSSENTDRSVGIAAVFEMPEIIRNEAAIA